MRSNRCGFSLMELIFAIALGLVVMSIGYGAYFSFMRADEAASERDSMMLTVRNAMSKMKHDVRSSSSLGGESGSLVLSGEDGRIIYRNAPGGEGLERAGERGRSVFKGVRAEFSQDKGENPGVSVRLRAESVKQGRPIRVELSTFVSPRNR